MSDMQKMEYAEAEQMVRILHEGSEKLVQTMEVIRKIADRLENGALLGSGGDALSSALREKLAPAIERLSDTLKERSDYVQTEIYDMQEAERRNQGLFN